MTEPKVSLISTDEIYEEQEKNEERKNIRKARRDRVLHQYYESERGKICRKAPRDKTVQIHLPVDLRPRASLIRYYKSAVSHLNVLKQYCTMC